MFLFERVLVAFYRYYSVFVVSLSDEVYRIRARRRYGHNILCLVGKAKAGLVYQQSYDNCIVLINKIILIDA